MIYYYAKQVVGNFCMDLAIKKAKEHGIGWVVCKGQLKAEILQLTWIVASCKKQNKTSELHLD